MLSDNDIKIAPSTYYDNVSRRPSKRAAADAVVIELIHQARTNRFVAAFGARKMWLHLRGKGHDVARCTIERLMHAEGMVGAMRGKDVRTTIADEKADRPADLVDRNFFATRPNQLWVADFTYVPTWQGMVYVAFIIDVFSRMIVGWRAARSMTTELVLDCFEMAVWARHRAGITDLAGLVHHTDAGSQYTSFAFTDRLIEAGIDSSIGSVGDAYALGESTIGLYKTELVKRFGPWRDCESVELETMEWVHWFNTERPHESIDDLTPEFVEQFHYDTKNGLAGTG